MADILVARFEDSTSFKNAKENISLLEELPRWSKLYSKRLIKAVEENSQINGSWGVPGRVTALIEKWEEKGV